MAAVRNYAKTSNEIFAASPSSRSKTDGATYLLAGAGRQSCLQRQPCRLPACWTC